MIRNLEDYEVQIMEHNRDIVSKKKAKKDKKKMHVEVES